MNIPEPKKSAYDAETLQLSAEEKYDKVLGALVGSAIGDAMGASTEMRHRDEIQLRYGYITGLTPAVRPQSPEGTWGNNLSAGATTDDTRWKYLMVKYLTESKGSRDAGQLYSPVLGLAAPNPEAAYTSAYDHALFDLGYARDISGLVAAMTHVAMRTTDMDSIINTATFVDPNGYQDSRLVGRIPYSVANASVKKVLETRNRVLTDSVMARDSLEYQMPDGYPGRQKEWRRQEMVYRYLENHEHAIAFHAGEIWRILITGLQFGDGDFEKTLQFIINYGRDNDTAGAVAGMILGAKEGYSNLPEKLRTTTLKVSKEVMGIDLEALAREAVAAMP